MNIDFTFFENESEQIHLYVTDTGYESDIDDESLLFNNIKKEIFSFGEIAIEIYNMLLKYNSFNELLKKYHTKYSTVTIEFIKECYYDFNHIGLSDLVSRTFIYTILQYCNNNFKEWSYEDIFSFIKFHDPALFSSYKKTHPYEAHVKAEFFEDVNGIPRICYTDFDLFDILVMDTIYLRKNNISIRSCSYCKKRFIQINGNNKKYCSDCKKLHNDQISNDEFYKLYRKKYKTMFQRRNRSSDPFKYEKEFMEPWENDIKTKMEEYKIYNDFQGFQQYIEQSMNQYKPLKTETKKN